MKPQKSYDIIRIPSDDWNNLAETLSLDGSYSEQIKNEVWSALEHIRFLSDPWVVVQITEGTPVKANLLADKEMAQKFAAKIKKKLPPDAHVLCIKAKYRQ